MSEALPSLIEVQNADPLRELYSVPETSLRLRVRQNWLYGVELDVLREDGSADIGLTDRLRLAFDGSATTAETFHEMARYLQKASCVAAS